MNEKNPRISKSYSERQEYPPSRPSSKKNQSPSTTPQYQQSSRKSTVTLSMVCTRLFIFRDLASNNYSTVTDLALREKRRQPNLGDVDNNSQVPGEINIATVLDCQVIAEQLQWDDVEQALHAVYGLGNADGLGASWDALVALITHDDGLAIASGDLGKCGLDFGV